MLFYLLVIFVGVCMLQILFNLVLFSRLATYKPNDEIRYSASEGVSVIIAAHNEFDNLQQFLPAILQQSYPLFEVIVVNDRSRDDTALLLASWQQQYAHLKVVHISETSPHFQPKKYAITQAVQIAQYPYLVLTDADCLPASEQWLGHVAQLFANPNTEIILGFSPYQQEKSFLNDLIQYETFMTAMQYLSMALLKMPYMGVGRNIAYRKDLFEKANGFGEYQAIIGGDDDLFVNQWANSKNTAICIHPKSFVYSVPKKDFQEWLIQKKRHLSVGKYYQKKHLFILGIFMASLHFFWILFFLLTLLYFLDTSPQQATYYTYGLIAWGSRQLSSWFVYRAILEKLGSKSLKIKFLYLEIVFLFFWTYTALQANISQRIAWK